jgi:glutamyl-Q tRNA(Asp) synthetase
MSEPIFRFAPSPNGHLHLGHAYSALIGLKMARELNGKMLLRIEDIDTTRCTPELETQMLKDLEWIGFEWDETPRRQSQHFNEYARYLDRLKDKGLLFPSVLSRSAIKTILRANRSNGIDWPLDPDGTPHYPGDEHLLDECVQQKTIESGEAYSLRFDIEKVVMSYDLSWQEYSHGEVLAKPLEWGKPILARKELPASYHLCCVVDDALQGVTHVVRGKDLYHATSLHRLLQEILDLPQVIYHHHELIVDKDGNKLSKSTQATSLLQLRNSGLKPSDILESLEEKGLFEDVLCKAHG